MNNLLVHAKDRRETVAYRASLDPADDVLELKREFIIRDHPSFYEECCGYAWFIASLVVLPISFAAWFVFCFAALASFKHADFLSPPMPKRGPGGMASRNKGPSPFRDA